MAYLNLYINWYAKALMKSPRNSAVFTLPSFAENDIVPIKLQILQPDPDNYNSYETPDIASMSISFTVEDPDDGEVVAAQYTWSKDTTNNRFHAEVDFGTATLATWLASAATKTAVLKIKKTEGTSVATCLQQNITIIADATGAELGSVLPTQTPISLETAQQLFAKKYMDAGDTITLRSADGTAGRTLGVYKDGSGNIMSQDDLYAI